VVGGGGGGRVYDTVGLYSPFSGCLGLASSAAAHLFLVSRGRRVHLTRTGRDESHAQLWDRGFGGIAVPDAMTGGRGTSGGVMMACGAVSAH
jgi:hypothetical protein